VELNFAQFLLPLTGLLAQMGTAFFVKWVSKAKASTGHKIGAPVAAFLVAAIAMFTGNEQLLVGGEPATATAVAVGVHSLLKNLMQTVGVKVPDGAPPA
jgi:hypothetical protein